MFLNLNRTIFERNKESKTKLKNTIVNWEIVSILIVNVFLIVLMILFEKHKDDNLIIGIVLIIGLILGLLYDVFIILFMTTRSYYLATKKKIEIIRSVVVDFDIEKKRKTDVFRILNEINEKETIAEYKNFLKKQITNSQGNIEKYVGGIQSLSLIGIVIAIMKSIEDIGESIVKEKYLNIVLIIIPIFVTYWLYIESIRRNRINLIIEYIEEWETIGEKK